MRSLPIAFVILLVCFIATFRLTAGDKHDATVDSKKLVGKWEGGFFVKSEDDKENKTQIEFTSDGVFKRKVTIQNVTIIDSEGKYTLDGNKLTMISKLRDGKQAKDVATVTKLTDQELEWRNSTELTKSFKRVK